MSEIIINVWRGKGPPDARDGQPTGQWDTLVYPVQSRDNAERAFAAFIRQGFYVDMVKPHNG